MKKTLLFGISNRNSIWYEVLDNQLIKELSEYYFIKIVSLNEFTSVKQYRRYLISLLDNLKCELFITSHNQSIIDSETLNSINKKTKSLLLLMDNLQRPFSHLYISRNYDLVWLFDNHTKFFSKKKINYINLPWANNPNLYKKYDGPIMKKVLYVGSIYGARKKLIWDIASRGFSIDVYTGFIDQSDKPKKSKRNSLFSKFRFIRTIMEYSMYKEGRLILISRLKWVFTAAKHDIYNHANVTFFKPVGFESLSTLYQQYRLVLSSNKLRSTSLLKSPVTHLTLKNFEVPGMGGLALVLEDDAMNSIFESDEIVMYNLDNLTETLEHYLMKISDSEIINYREKARARTVMDHSWTSRFHKINSLLGIENEFK